jgi:hypothetical protein
MLLQSKSHPTFYACSARLTFSWYLSLFRCPHMALGIARVEGHHFGQGVYLWFQREIQPQVRCRQNAA